MKRYFLYVQILSFINWLWKKKIWFLILLKQKWVTSSVTKKNELRLYICQRSFIINTKEKTNNESHSHREIREIIWRNLKIKTKHLVGRLTTNLVYSLHFISLEGFLLFFSSLLWLICREREIYVQDLLIVLKKKDLLIVIDNDNITCACVWCYMCIERMVRTM